MLPDGRTVVDLQAAVTASGGSPSPHLADMLAFLDGGGAARETAERALEFAVAQRPPDVCHSLDTLQLLAPVPRPRSIRDALSFEKHLVQCAQTIIKWKLGRLGPIAAWLERVRGRASFSVPRVWYERPIYYKGNPHSVVGHDAEVRWPKFTQKLDYELEFGIFLGRTGRDIPKDKAHEYIGGYTIFNDFSARDVQLREMTGRLGPAKCKDFDTGNAMGPMLVTPDEVPDPYGLTMIARVNGQEWSRGTSRDMHYTFAEMIASISQDETLYPGEFIGSGTVGNGCGLELDRWLRRGDVVELEVDRLGILRNRVV
jgi:2-keto-4-pentenoate hydratase/2-oxohepta-3-ene-1,7-dioic acid hydratase in catechol pathway